MDFKVFWIGFNLAIFWGKGINPGRQTTGRRWWRFGSYRPVSEFSSEIYSLSLVYKKKISHVKPKWEFSVATIIPNHFRANREFNRINCRKESRNSSMSFLFYRLTWCKILLFRWNFICHKMFLKFWTFEKKIILRKLTVALIKKENSIASCYGTLYLASLSDLITMFSVNCLL